jgi:hypothetical protein
LPSLNKKRWVTLAGRLTFFIEELYKLIPSPVIIPVSVTATVAAVIATIASATPVTGTTATAAAVIATASAAATVVATATSAAAIITTAATAVAATTAAIVATATTATVITAATTTIAATAAITTSAATIVVWGTLSRLLYGHLLTPKTNTVQQVNGFKPFLTIRHLYETETTAFPGFLIQRNFGRFYFTVQFKHFF